MILIAERVCHRALPFTHSGCRGVSRGCRLGVHERKDILLARPGRHAHRPAKRYYRLRYRFGQAIANDTLCLRYRILALQQSVEDAGGSWRHEDGAVELAG